MDESEHQLKKLEEFKNHLLGTIKTSSPLVLEAINSRDKNRIKDLLSQFFVDNMDILNKIVIIRTGKGKRFSKEELDNIKKNLLKVMK